MTFITTEAGKSPAYDWTYMDSEEVDALDDLKGVVTATNWADASIAHSGDQAFTSITEIESNGALKCVCVPNTTSGQALVQESPNEDWCIGVRICPQRSAIALGTSTNFSFGFGYMNGSDVTSGALYGGGVYGYASTPLDWYGVGGLTNASTGINAITSWSGKVDAVDGAGLMDIWLKNDSGDLSVYVSLGIGGFPFYVGTQASAVTGVGMWILFAQQQNAVADEHHNLILMARARRTTVPGIG